MALKRYDFRCMLCQNVEERLAEYETRKQYQKCKCGGAMMWLFPVQAALGFQPFDAHYDESLGVDIHSRREKQRILRDKGLIEAGDTVHGSRNFDRHAPDHIGPQPVRGIPYQKRIKMEKTGWDVGVVSEGGSVKPIDI